MVRLTQSLFQWLWDNHRDIIALIQFGHLELLTDEMCAQYVEWLKTEDGRKYLKGGSEYDENWEG